MTITIEDKIQAIKDKNIANLQMGPTEVSQQEADTLHTTWLNAETAAKGAPEDAAVAKKAYYTYIDGDAAYKSRLTKQYTAQADKLRAKMVKNYEAKADVVNTDMAYYHSQLTYTGNTDMVKIDLLEKIKNMTYKLRQIKIDKSTNNRKTFYLHQQSNSFTHWNMLFLAMYIAFGILCIDQMMQTKSYKKYGPLLIILIFYMTPWFQSLVFTTISKAQSTADVLPNDVYTEWRKEASNTIANSGPSSAHNTGLNRTVYDPNSTDDDDDGDDNDDDSQDN
jgi:hypothetical protein